VEVNWKRQAKGRIWENKINHIKTKIIQTEQQAPHNLD
jgi:hypothetical protein